MGGGGLYNNLPGHVKNLNCMQLFRRKLKLFYYSIYSVEGYIEIFYHGKCNCIWYGDLEPV
jgi:hypothetical protein